MIASRSALKTPLQRLLKRPLWLILCISLLLHLTAGLFFGSWKIFSILTKDEAVFEVTTPPQSIQPKQRDYKIKTMRAQRSTAMATQVPITVDIPNSIDLPSIQIPRAQNASSAIKARGEAGSFGAGLGGTGDMGFATLFGNTAPLAGALEGTFIDLKQDRYREGVPKEDWMDVGKGFLRNFRLREFRKFFNAPQKLFATHFYIPMMDAGEAPRAYGVENLVQPKNWVANYAGKFRSPSGGKYRFVGTADDILIVGVDGKTVLSAGFTESNPGKWEPEDEPIHPGPPVSEYLPKLTFGDWFDLPAGTPVDLSILIGEMPGGEFACYLFIEKRGQEYGTTPAGRPILPVFKLKEFSRSERQTIEQDGYPKRLDGEVFGYF